MNQDAILRGFQSLPPEAQKQVADFITFLQTRYKPTRRKTRQTHLSAEAFVGIWKDRDDLQDSSKWVRETRTREWEQKQ